MLPSFRILHVEQVDLGVAVSNDTIVRGPVLVLFLCSLIVQQADLLDRLAFAIARRGLNGPNPSGSKSAVSLFGLWRTAMCRAPPAIFCRRRKQSPS